MAKKRKPGGGRKPNPNKRVMFSTRLEPEVMALLKAAAAEWPGGNISAFTEFLISKGLREREEEERNRPLRALNYMIALLGEKISSPVFVVVHSSQLTDEERRAPDAAKPGKLARDMQLSDLWRTDPFRFKAFKVAVKKLLDALEEPPGEIRPPLTEAQQKRSSFGHDEFAKRMRKSLSSPEEYGAFKFEQIWWQSSQRPAPLSDREKQFFQMSPILGKALLSEFYALPKARRDLELKPKEAKP